MLKIKLRKAASCLICLFILTSQNGCADSPDTSGNHFQKLFTDWTYAFNQQDLEKSCALFSKDVTATYQSISHKNYDAICGGFKKIFNNKQVTYHYDFKILQTYEDNKLAAVRITWYLKVYQNDKLIEEVQDEGLDVLQKDIFGNWKIVNYLGFPVSE